MKAKKLVTLAIPIMLLAGCGTDKTDAKPKEKIESKSETKDKLSKEQYPVRMTSLSSELMNKISTITEIAMDKTKDEKDLVKEIVKEETELQKIISKFDKIEPPKGFKDSHKEVLKALDCYSKAYALQVEIIKGKGKVTDEDRNKSQKSMDLIKEGNGYWKTGFQPIEDATVKQANALGFDTGAKTDTPSTSKSDDDNVQISADGKELFGSWGSYKGSEFHKGLDFREDNSFTAYDDTGKSSYEDNHMTGTWLYNADKKQVTMIPTEFVKDGKKIDARQMNAVVDYTVEFFRAGSLRMVDSKGNKIEAERQK
ncbi:MULTISPECIES: DUF7018 domain-containing (lipo)protein [Bacillus]|uniref:DUF7018 domain-containing (lipo)protein n=1 Tax=Bacillus TaxID=1386 RepID=UPI0001A14E43|nr:MULTISPECIES: DUF3994 domain-containing protein [Bacillus]AIK38181.1 hypothetical protein DJ92_666 [Bacillus pseudomycoides]AJI16060.1 hypothetical protein BG07_4268 [Bacillus pseudomycoides]EEM16050.1 hypothetical protein bpmyx0001_31350 [Bacillus pseudomycoides DSM 12442]MCX2828019.1 DUF3994 domain-containing protein [Bacillus sp. DHT2]MDR4916134.1 DUF3994 domain-containing protein [Bacillus pseudomycoides]